MHILKVLDPTSLMKRLFARVRILVGIFYFFDTKESAKKYMPRGSYRPPLDL